MAWAVESAGASTAASTAALTVSVTLSLCTHTVTCDSRIAAFYGTPPLLLVFIAVALSEATGPASNAALFLLVSFCYAMSKLAGTVKAIYKYFTIAASFPTGPQ